MTWEETNNFLLIFLRIKYLNFLPQNLIDQKIFTARYENIQTTMGWPKDFKFCFCF